MDRRSFLRGGLVLAATSHAAANAPEMVTAAAVSIDEFLKVATPAEIARYHTDALMDAMAALRPDIKFMALTDINLGYVHVVGTAALASKAKA